MKFVRRCYIFIKFQVFSPQLSLLYRYGKQVIIKPILNWWLFLPTEYLQLVSTWLTTRNNPTRVSYQPICHVFQQISRSNAQRDYTSKTIAFPTVTTHLFFCCFCFIFSVGDCESHIWIKLSWCTFCRIELSSSGLSPMYSTQSLCYTSSLVT